MFRQLLLLTLLLAALGVTGCTNTQPRVLPDDDDDDATADDDDATADDDDATVDDDDATADDDDSVAESFACGDTLFCTVGIEYCEIMYPGVKGAPIGYTCNGVPKACLATPDCDCIEAELGFDGAADCTDGPDGGVTFSIYLP